MTSPTLKYVLVDALNASQIAYSDTRYDNPNWPDQPRGGGVEHSLDDGVLSFVAGDSWYFTDYDADRLTQAITDHFSTVWEVGLYSEAKATFRSKAKAEAYLAAAIAADAGNYEADWWWMGEVKVLNDDAADRLIEALTGKGDRSARA